MASCTSAKWVGNSPQIKLEVTTNTATDTSVKYDWKLYYIASSAASTNSARSWTVKVDDGKATGTFNINGKTGTHLIDKGSETIQRGTSAKTISFSCSMNIDLTWSGVKKGTISASGTFTLGKKTSYTVKFNPNGGSGAPSSQTKWHGTDLTLSSTKPKKTGYVFMGWGTSASDESVNWSAGGKYTANAGDTLYAIWRKTITVSYNVNGGTGTIGATTGYAYNSATSTSLKLSASTPAKSNYTFLGWSTSASATSANYSANGTYTFSSNVTLYAIWRRTLKLTYDVNTGNSLGSVSSSQSGNVYNSTTSYTFTIPTPTTPPSKAGYTFLGWSTSKSATSASYTEGKTISISSDTILYAVWKIITHTITYDVNGGNASSLKTSSQSKNYGSTATISNQIPTRTDYNFLGWSTNDSATVPEYKVGATNSYSTNADVTLYAIWELAYNNPTINNLIINRCHIDSESGEIITDENGTYASLSFDWSCFTSDTKTCTIKKVTVSWISNNETLNNSVEYLFNGDESTTNGKFSKLVGRTTTGTNSDTGEEIVTIEPIEFSTDSTFEFTITVTDNIDSTSETIDLGGTVFVIDALKGGNGIAFGKPAEIDGLFDVNFKSRFRNDIELYDESKLKMNNDYYFDSNGNAKINNLIVTEKSNFYNNVYIGTSKTKYDDGKAGVLIDSLGDIWIQRTDGSPSYIAFQVSGQTSDYGARIAYNTNDHLEFLGATGYRFDKQLVCGNKTTMWDNKSGIAMSAVGCMEIQRTDGNAPYIAFTISGQTEYGARLSYGTNDMLYLQGASAYVFDNYISTTGAIYMNNEKHLYIKNASGTSRAALGITDDNKLLLGYGAYEASEGSTNIYGNYINIFSKDEIQLRCDNIAICDVSGTSIMAVNNVGKLRLGVGSFDTTNTKSLYCYWKDNSAHDVITVATDGLSSSFGWAGSSSYATVTTLRGRTCRYSNASGTATLSDIRLKKDFTSLDRWEVFFDAIEPCAFKMKNGSSGRFHLGYKAQQIEEALLNSGLTTQDFAGFIKTPYIIDEEDEERTAIYKEAGIKEGDCELGLIYTEFTALNTGQIQKLKERFTVIEIENTFLKDENATLKDKVDSLENRLVNIEKLIKDTY